MYILCKCYSIYGIPVIVYYVVYVTMQNTGNDIYTAHINTLSCNTYTFCSDTVNKQYVN